MQNKYKLPDHVRAAALAVVKSYEPFKRDIETEENECKYSFVQAVESALDEILKEENQIYSLKLRQARSNLKKCEEKTGFSSTAEAAETLIYQGFQGSKTAQNSLPRLKYPKSPLKRL